MKCGVVRPVGGSGGEGWKIDKRLSRSRSRWLLRSHHGGTREGIKAWAGEDILRLAMMGIVLTKQQTMAGGTTGTVVVVFVGAGEKKEEMRRESRRWQDEGCGGGRAPPGGLSAPIRLLIGHGGPERGQDGRVGDDFWRFRDLTAGHTMVTLRDGSDTAMDSELLGIARLACKYVIFHATLILRSSDVRWLRYRPSPWLSASRVEANVNIDLRGLTWPVGQGTCPFAAPQQHARATGST